nr:alanine--glyoxylate aminotransferase family protein [Tissierella sp.]
MNRPLIMTPGPTQIHEDVRFAMAQQITNPDLDLNFFEKYKEICEKLQKLLRTREDVLILAGEGMLGLEAACASLIEPGDRVLCIDNGIFGKGLADFAKLYGGDVVFFNSDPRKGIDPRELEEFLKNDSKFKVATLVHCETPSGLLNPVEEIGPLLNKFGILSIVDTVSSAAGVEVEVDKWKIDISLGASQKCISAAPGLSILSVSHRAWSKILNRKTPIASFYCNLKVWKDWYKDKAFPYTQPISDIYGLETALDRILNGDDYVKRHKKIGTSLRKALVDGGLELYTKDCYADTVTSILVPKGTSFERINRIMLDEHNIMIAGAFDVLKDKVFRIGNMGENAKEEYIYITLKALDQTLKELRVDINGSLHRRFADNMDEYEDNINQKISFSNYIKKY